MHSETVASVRLCQHPKPKGLINNVHLLVKPLGLAQVAVSSVPDTDVAVVCSAPMSTYLVSALRQVPDMQKSKDDGGGATTVLGLVLPVSSSEPGLRGVLILTP